MGMVMTFSTLKLLARFSILTLTLASLPGVSAVRNSKKSFPKPERDPLISSSKYQVNDNPLLVSKLPADQGKNGMAVTRTKELAEAKAFPG